MKTFSEIKPGDCIYWVSVGNLGDIVPLEINKVIETKSFGVAFEFGEEECLSEIQIPEKYLGYSIMRCGRGELYLTDPRIKEFTRL